MLVQTVSWPCPLKLSWPCSLTGFRLSSLLIVAPDADCCSESVKTSNNALTVSIEANYCETQRDYQVLICSAGIVAGFSAFTFKHVVEDLPYKTIAAGNLGPSRTGMADPDPNYCDASSEGDSDDEGSSSDIKDISFSQSNSLHVPGKDKCPANTNSGSVDAALAQNPLYGLDSKDMQLASDLAAATNALKNERCLLSAKWSAPGESVLPVDTDAHCRNERRIEMANAFLGTNMDIVGASSNNGFEEQETSTSLRAWLSNSARVIDKIENLHIFKQIAEFVELAHCQGVVLRNVRPSSFLLSPMSRISIIESASSHTSSSSSAESTGRGAASNLVDVGQSDLNKVTQLFSNPASARTMGFEMQREYRSSVPMDGQWESKHFANGSEDSTSQSFQTVKGKHVANEDEGGRSYTSSSSDHADNQLDVERFPLKEILSMESMWYKSPEELGGGTPEFSSDMYSLGVLFVELFYSSGSQGEWSRAMSDLRHRLLPPSFLLGFAKEASFCLLLLHPSPDSRPKAREVLHADIFSEIEDKLAEKDAIMHLEEKLSEAETTLDFLLLMQQRKHAISQKLVQELSSLQEDIGEVKRWQALLMKNSWHEGCRNKSMKLVESSTFGAGGSKFLSGLLIGDEVVTGSSNRQDELIGRRHELVVTKSSQLLKSFTQLRESYLKMMNTEQHSGIDVTSEISKQSKPRSEHLEKMGIVHLLDNMSGSKAVPRIGVRLGCFFDEFCQFMKYSKFDVKATLQYGDILNTKNMVCSLSFDCDDEYFATAGVSRRIKIFDCNALLEEFNEVHYPVIEMSSRKKLSCVSWNKFRKNLLASSDLEGFIQLWDVTTGQTVMDLNEHSKCAWAVDFSHFDSSRLASGSDDCFVKLWSTSQGTSIGTIKTKANICSVQFSPHHSHILAFGSADSQVYFHDLRYIRIPICILTGHQKAVSFIRFSDPSSIVSASTDNTLKLWDLTKTSRVTRGYGAGLGSKVDCAVTYTGHTNLKNFVGLSVAAEGYIACGSETNEVVVYHKSIPVPMLSHKFKSADPISGEELEDLGDQFVSSVCWRNRSPVLVMANSVGNIQVLEMS